MLLAFDLDISVNFVCLFACFIYLINKANEEKKEKNFF